MEWREIYLQSLPAPLLTEAQATLTKARADYERTLRYRKSEDPALKARQQELAAQVEAANSRLSVLSRLAKAQGAARELGIRRHLVSPMEVEHVANWLAFWQNEERRRADSVSHYEVERWTLVYRALATLRDCQEETSAYFKRLDKSAG